MKTGTVVLGILSLTCLSPSAKASQVSLLSFDAIVREAGKDEVLIVAPRYSNHPISGHSDAATLCQLLGFRPAREAETSMETRPPRGGSESALIISRNGLAEAIEPQAQRLVRAIECRSG